MERALVKEVSLYNREHAPFKIDYSTRSTYINGEWVYGVVYSFVIFDHQFPPIIPDVCDTIAAMPGEFGGGRDIEIIFMQAFKGNPRLEKLGFDSEGSLFECHSLDFYTLQSLCTEFIPMLKDYDLCINLLLQGAEGTYNHPNYKKPSRYDIPKAKAAFLKSLSEEDREEYMEYHEMF